MHKIWFGMFPLLHILFVQQITITYRTEGPISDCTKDSNKEHVATALIKAIVELQFKQFREPLSPVLKRTCEFTLNTSHLFIYKTYLAARKALLSQRRSELLALASQEPGCPRHPDFTVGQSSYKAGEEMKPTAHQMWTCGHHCFLTYLTASCSSSGPPKNIGGSKTNQARLSVKTVISFIFL